MISRLRFALGLMLLVLVFSLGLVLGKKSIPATNPSSKAVADVKTQSPDAISDQTRKFKVIKVIDGDTVELSDGRKVRYLGIDAPETGRPFAGEAQKLNAQMVWSREVRLEFDAGGREDKYGRLLAYLWIDQIFVNERLLEEGLAKILIFGSGPPLKYQSRLRAAEAQAQKSAKGLWQKDWIN